MNILNYFKNKRILLVLLTAVLISCADTTDTSNNNSTLNNTGSVQIIGTAHSGNTLTAFIVDLDGFEDSAVSYKWQLYRNNSYSDVTNATAKTYALTNADIGSQIRVNVSYTDNQGNSESIDSTLTNVVQNQDNQNDSTSNTGTIAISGNIRSGEVLTAVITDLDGYTNSAVSYQWQNYNDNSYSDIANATAQTYSLTSSDIDTQLRVYANYIDDQGNTESIYSALTDNIQEAAELPTGGNFDRGTLGDNDSVPVINCDTVVTSLSALEDNVSNDMVAGTTICLADGTYTNDLSLDFGGIGTVQNPITVAAANPGAAIISGASSVQMAGEYVVLQGLVFLNGATENSDLIQTRTSSTEFCNYCRITEIAIIDLDDANADSGKWLNIYGQHNRIDHNWFAGKTNEGALLIINREAPDSGAAQTEIDYVHIDHNYFGDRPPADGKPYPTSGDNGFEAIRTGTSDSHAYSSYSVVEYNYFERIDAEAEVISNKAGNNRISNNTVRDSYGSITLRHGSSAVLANNFMIGDGHPFAGGLRIIDDGHRIVNNYIAGARYLSSNFHGGIVVHNSNGSTSNGYQDVTNVLIAHNTIVNSVNSLNFHGGNESKSPNNIYFVNNIIKNAIGALIKNGDEGLPANATYAGNYYEASTFSDDNSLSSAAGFSQVDIALTEDTLAIYRLSSGATNISASAVSTGSFDAVLNDMDGQNRSSITTSGADEYIASSKTIGVLTADDVGPINYRPQKSKGYVVRIPISNDDFEDGATGWTLTSPDILTNNANDVFAGNLAIAIDNATDRVSKSLTIQANTNYSLSAFINGKVQLGVILNGVEQGSDSNYSSYKFANHTFNSNTNTTVTIFAKLAEYVTNYFAIGDSDFTDFNGSTDNNWTTIEGVGIGQVQRSSNSASGSDGSARLRWDDTYQGGSPEMRQVINNIPSHTNLTIAAYILDKQDTAAAIRIGVYSGNSTNILASQDFLYTSLDASNADEGDDSFLKGSLTFNSGSQTSLTLFIQYIDNGAGGADLRVDDISISYEGVPDAGSEAFVDEFRLVAYPGN